MFFILSFSTPDSAWNNLLESSSVFKKSTTAVKVTLFKAVSDRSVYQKLEKRSPSLVPTSTGKIKCPFTECKGVLSTSLVTHVFFSHLKHLFYSDFVCDFSLSLQALLQLNPYHIDSLLQLSDVCRIQEDQEMARDLIGESRVSSVNHIHFKLKTVDVFGSLQRPRYQNIK